MFSGAIFKSAYQVGGMSTTQSLDGQSFGSTLNEPGCLVMLETGGNQRYIFGTNRLIENLGGSELLYRSCVDWVADAIDGTGGIVSLTATSGRALLWCRTDELARSLVETITFRALREAPGLVLSAAVREWTPGRDFSDSFRTLARSCEQAAGASGGGIGRFLRYPVVEPCASTGYPAESMLTFRSDGVQERRPVSEVVRSKRAVANDAKSRLADSFSARLPNNLGDLEERFLSEEEIGWIAVIHADGNGVGQAFINLSRWVQETLGKGPDQIAADYVDAYRELSERLQQASDQALRAAVQAVQGESETGTDSVPIVPIVFGGDDLGVIMDARIALEFVEIFAARFETSSATALVEFWSAQFGERARPTDFPHHFTLGAGIAIVKPHFPFHAAYRLAEELADGAKKAAKVDLGPTEIPDASIDFHLLSDSIGTNLEEIQRVRRGARDGLSLRGGPYLICPEADTSETHGHLRTTADLRRALITAGERRDERRVISASALNKIRSAAFLGRDEATVANEYLETPIPSSILDWRASGDGGPMSTMIIDVIDVVELWGNR